MDKDEFLHLCLQIVTQCQSNFQANKYCQTRFEKHPHFQFLLSQLSEKESASQILKVMEVY